jgi:hypothetical protein
MKFAKTITSDVTGHTMHVSEIPAEQVPDLENKLCFTKFYAVRNWDAEGLTFMYLGKGNKDAPKEVVAWYAKHGSFWSGCGKNLKEAIEGAQRSGWMYA